MYGTSAEHDFEISITFYNQEIVQHANLGWE